jgi:hypothetical protein
MRHLFILCIFKTDDEDTNKISTLPLWTEAEELLSDVAFHYAFGVEDEATKESLQAFIDSRPHYSFLLHSAKNFNDLLKHIRHVATWTELMKDLTSVAIFYDPHVFFSPLLTITKLLHVIENNSDVAYVGCYSKELDDYFPGAPSVTLPFIGKHAISGHYYDTDSVLDVSGRKLQKNKCPMPKCRKCNEAPGKPPEDGLLDVATCYGGFSVTRAINILPDFLEWKSLAGLSSFIYACHMISVAYRIRTGKRGRCVISLELPVYWKKERIDEHD